MNLQDYIDSGVLELYASGLLNEQEMQEVDLLVARYPELEKELDEIFSAMETFHQKSAKTPSTFLKSKILNSIPELNYPSTESKLEAPIIDMPMVKNPISYLYPFAASLILFLLSAAALFVVWQELEQTKTKLTALQSENELFASNLTNLKSETERSNSILDNYRDTSFVKVQLKGLPIAPNSNAVVFWNKSTQIVLLDMVDMPATDANHEYQLWALDNGKPVDAGVFDSKEELQSLIQLKKISNAQGFAVTLEPNGGSVNPTMDQMYLYAAI